MLPILRMPALNGVGARPATLRDLRGGAGCTSRCFDTGCVPDGFKPVFSTVCFNRASLPASGTVSVRTGAAATSGSGSSVMIGCCGSTGGFQVPKSGGE